MDTINKPTSGISSPFDAFTLMNPLTSIRPGKRETNCSYNELVMVVTCEPVSTKHVNGTPFMSTWMVGQVPTTLSMSNLFVEPCCSPLKAGSSSLSGSSLLNALTLNLFFSPCLSISSNNKWICGSALNNSDIALFSHL